MLARGMDCLVVFIFKESREGVLSRDVINACGKVGMCLWDLLAVLGTCELRFYNLTFVSEMGPNCFMGLIGKQIWACGLLLIFLSNTWACSFIFVFYFL